jgi:hypothetical protein
MTRYFFDVMAAGNLIPDEEGMILPNMEAARREASRSLADLARDAVRNDGTPRLAISVRTDDGPVCEAAFEWNIGPSTKGYHQPAPQTRPCADADRPAHDSRQRAGAPAVFPEWRGRLAGSGIGSVSGPFVFSPYKTKRAASR